MNKYHFVNIIYNREQKKGKQNYRKNYNDYNTCGSQVLLCTTYYSVRIKILDAWFRRVLEVKKMKYKGMRYL